MRSKKHGTLHSIAHNFAASISGGLSFIAPNHVLGFDIYSSDEIHKKGQVVVDFLNHQCDFGDKTTPLNGNLRLISDAFPEFCRKNGVGLDDFNALVVRFVLTATDKLFIVTIEDRDGKRSSREYSATNGSRTLILDSNGRPRPATLINPLD